MRTLLVSLLVAPLACACTSDGGGLPPPNRDLATDGDAPVGPDVSVEPGEVPEEVVEECTVDLGAFVPSDTWSVIKTDQDLWLFSGSITDSLASDPYSAVSIESWYGAADGPTEPGTYTLEGRVSTHDCGLCLFVFEDCTPDSGNPPDCAHHYVGIRGTLEITDLVTTVGGPVGGTLTGAAFQEVDWGEDVLVPDGRGYCLDTWSFGGTLADFYGG